MTITETGSLLINMLDGSELEISCVAMQEDEIQHIDGFSAEGLRNLRVQLAGYIARRNAEIVAG